MNEFSDHEGHRKGGWLTHLLRFGFLVVARLVGVALGIGWNHFLALVTCFLRGNAVHKPSVLDLFFFCLLALMGACVFMMSVWSPWWCWWEFEKSRLKISIRDLAWPFLGNNAPRDWFVASSLCILSKRRNIDFGLSNTPVQWDATRIFYWYPIHRAWCQIWRRSHGNLCTCSLQFARNGIKLQGHKKWILPIRKACTSHRDPSVTFHILARIWEEDSTET